MVHASESSHRIPATSLFAQLLRVPYVAVAFILSVTTVSGVLGSQQTAEDRNAAILLELDMRRNVTEGSMPSYPDEALRAGSQGTAMVAVLFDEDGNLCKAAVLESPHPAITEAVTAALKQWKTHPWGTSLHPRVRLASWLSFDFKIKRGVGYVAYTSRTADDNKIDKRYVHPFAGGRFPFYYRYVGSY